MSILSTIKSWISVDEAWVLKTIVQFNAAVQVTAKDLAKAVGWINGEIPSAIAFVKTVEGLIAEAQAAGVPMPPQVSAAIATANVVMAGINAYAANVSAGAPTIDAVLTGYAAVKQAQAAGANAAAAVATASVR